MENAGLIAAEAGARSVTYYRTEIVRLTLTATMLLEQSLKLCPEAVAKANLRF